MKIARLATSQKYEGRGIGENMLKVVIKLALNISEISGCRILTVDAKPKAVGFYKKYGFKKVLEIPMTQFHCIGIFILIIDKSYRSKQGDYR